MDTMTRERKKSVARPPVEIPDPLPSFSGEEIKAIREGRGLTQRAAAKLIGVKLRTWAGYEMGEKPSDAVAKLIYLLSKKII